MNENWAEKYISKDFIDCWQFVRTVYKNQLEIDLPEYSGIMITDIKKIVQTMEIESKTSTWIKLERPKDMCAVAMSKGTFIHHVGVYTKIDGGKILHSFEKNPVAAHDEVQLKRQGFKRVEYYELSSISDRM